MKIAEFKRNSSRAQGPNCIRTFLESVSARMLRGMVPLPRRPKFSMSPKCACFFLAVIMKSADQGDPLPVVFILHPVTPKLVLVSKLVLNGQKDWMCHHCSKFTRYRFLDVIAFRYIHYITQIFLE